MKIIMPNGLQGNAFYYEDNWGMHYAPDHLTRSEESFNMLLGYEGQVEVVDEKRRRNTVSGPEAAEMLRMITLSGFCLGDAWAIRDDRDMRDLSRLAEETVWALGGPH
jgi:hypothetical protein